MEQELVNAIEEIWGEDWEMYVSPYMDLTNLKSVEMQHKHFPITVILDDRKVMVRVRSEDYPLPFGLLIKVQLTIEYMSVWKSFT